MRNSGLTFHGSVGIELKNAATLYTVSNFIATPDRLCKSVSIVLVQQHAVRMKACTNVRTQAAVYDKTSSVTVIMTVATGRRNSHAVSDKFSLLTRVFCTYTLFTTEILIVDFTDGH